MQFLQMNFKILDDIEIMTHFQRFANEYLPNPPVVKQTIKWTTGYFYRGTIREKLQILWTQSRMFAVLLYLLILIFALVVDRTMRVGGAAAFGFQVVKGY
jgi:hypothetical protein